MSTSLFATADDGNAVVHNEFSTANITNTVDQKTMDMANNSETTSGGMATIGTAFQIMTVMYGDKVSSVNRGELSTEALKVEGHTEESMTAFNQELKQQIESDAVTNSAVGLSNEPGQFKCYIARDIPFQYQCTKTMLTYGGGVNETGKEARNKCKSECYQQNTCLNAATGVLIEDATISLSESLPTYKFFDPNLTYEETYKLDSERVLKNISITFSVEDESGELVPNKFFKADVYAVEADGEERLVVKRNYIGSYGNVKSWHIERHIQEIRIVYYNEASVGYNVRVVSAEALYKAENRWFCPMVQDIKTLNIDSFASNCPSGNTIEVTSGEKSAKICIDGRNAGNNKDGTFSEKGSCESICRLSFQCRAVTQVISTTQVENYREGCLAGQSNCSADDCRIARLTDMTVINEVSFDAEMNPTSTVLSGNQVSGAKRPRFTKEETLDFEEKKIQEWKDESYQNMVEQGRYNTTLYPIGEDTKRSSAFSVGIGTASDGTSNGLHELLWRIKPTSFEATGEDTYYMYSVFEIDAEHWGYSLDGKEVPHRDRIFYIKTSKGNTFKPFMRYKNYGVVDLDERGVPSIIKNEYSTPRGETFTGTSWIPMGQSSLAPYFKTTRFENPEFFFTEKLVTDMQRINYFMPGMRRSVQKNGPIETPVYTGFFDGSGDNIARVATHVYYSKERLTYEEVFASIRQSEIEDTPQLDNQFVKIYDTGFDKKSTRELTSDGDEEAQPNIDIFRYGNTDDTSMFFRIKPHPIYVGQKGFVYVFIY